MTALPTSAPIKVRAYHHGDLRLALLAEACERVEQGGAENVSLASIAKSIGVSQAAPYRHFADRDALLATVATRGFEQFSHALETAINKSSGAERLLALGHAYVSFAVAHPGLYQLMFASRLLAGAETGDELKSASHDSYNILASLLADARQEPSASLSLEIWVALHGAAMLAVHGLLADNPSGIGLDSLIEMIASRGVKVGEFEHLHRRDRVPLCGVASPA